MLREEKEIDFKALFESAPGLYLVLSPDLIILAISDAYANATMTKREEIIDKHLFEVFPDNPNNRTADGVYNLRASLNSVLKNKIAHTMAVQKYDIRRLDGTFEKRYWSPRNKPVLNSKNEVIYIIHRVEDVTDFILLKNEQSGKDKTTSNLETRSLEMAEELIIANKELAFQNEEKGKHEIELIVANKELAFQNQEKGKRADELLVAYEELLKSEGIIIKLNEGLEQKITDRTAQLEDIYRDISDYRFALDESSIVAVTSHKGIILHVNDNFCKISKYTKKELIGQDHRIINSGYHSKEFIRELWETIANGKIWKGEMKNKAKDGTIYWVDTTIVPFLNEHGKPYKYLAIRSDITQRKNSLEELEASEDQYRDLFENSLVAMYITDPKTRKTIYTNEMGVAFFGYKSKEDFIENYNSSAHFVDSSDIEKMRQDIVEKGEANHNQVKMKKLDGTYIWVKLFSKKNAKKNSVQTVLLDITERIHFQEELEKKVNERTLELTNSLEREKEMNEMKSRFVSMASHEFRTPLSTILSSASLIEQYKESEQQDKRLKHINRINSSVRDLTEILNDFLSLGQLEKGIIVAENNLFNLPEFIKELAEEMNGDIRKKNLRINFYHDGEAIIEQSKKILKNVLANLLSNAIKYSPKEKEINLISSVINNKVSVTVKDYGIGIPEEEQKHLFTEFYRARNVENIQGTGLGLIIAKKYVELLGGNISFISKPNEGTMFTIQFPQNNKPKPSNQINKNIAMN